MFHSHRAACIRAGIPGLSRLPRPIHGALLLLLEGFAALVAAILFFASSFLSPLFGQIPSVSPAAALPPHLAAQPTLLAMQCTRSRDKPTSAATFPGAAQQGSQEQPGKGAC